MSVFSSSSFSATSSHHAVENTPPESINQALPKKRTLCQKIMSVVKAIFTVMACLTLFVVNPTLFLLGFLAVGLAFSEKVKEVAEKIRKLCHKYPVGTGFIIPAALFIAWPAVLMVSSISVGAHLGSRA